jgi:hypothetical protein
MTMKQNEGIRWDASETIKTFLHGGGELDRGSNSDET